MGIRFFDPSEPSLEQQHTSAERFAILQSGVTAESAAQVSRMFAMNPNLRPGTGLALAQAGVDPEGPIAAAASQKEAERRTRQGFGWHSIGDVVSGAFGKASDAVGAVADPVYDTIKGVSRGAFIGLEALPQTFQGAFRESVRDSDISGSEWLLGLPNLGKGFQQTTLKAGIDQIRESFDRGEPFQGLRYGSGFFGGSDTLTTTDPNGNSVETQVGVKATQVQRARAAAPLIDGHAASLGRYAAKQVFEPGSKPYGLLSGTIDAGLLLGADPTSWLGGGAGLGKLGSAGAREAIERGKTFSGSKGDVAHDLPAPLSPAAATARAFGEGDISASTFLDRAVDYGSANPRVQATVDSLSEGLLTREEAVSSIESMRHRIRLEAGVVDGLRKTVLSDVANDFLTMNKVGRESVRVLTQTRSPAALRRAMKHVDMETIVRLAQARSDGEVIGVLGPEIGTTIRDRIDVTGAFTSTDTGFKVKVKKARASSRWLAMMPHPVTDLEDLDDVVEQVDRIGATVKMSLDKRDQWVDRMAFTANRNERLQVMKDMMDDIQNEVIGDGAKRLDANARKALTSLYGTFDDVESFRTYAQNELGNPLAVPGAPVIKVGDEVIPQASPHLLSEHVGQYMPLPDPRDLRRATSKVFAVLDKIPGATRTADALITVGDTATKIFKTGALARVAYPLRVIAEEQARIAGSGQHSAYAHPLSYIAIVTGRSMTKDIKGDLFTESTAIGDALSSGSAGMFGQSGKVQVRGKRSVRRDDPEFARSLTDNLSEFFHDELARRVAMGRLFPDDRAPANLPGVDGIKDWFFYGDGAAQRVKLRTGSNSHGAPITRQEIFSKKFDPEDALNSSDGYVDSMVERLRVATGGDPRLMDAIATGVIDGAPLMRQVGPKQFVPNKDAVARVQAILDEGPEVGPQFAKGDVFVNPKGQDPSFAALGRAYDAGVEKMFEFLMAKPTNALSRSPEFKQLYWKRQTELIGYMRPEVQEGALRVARESGLPKDVLRKLEAGRKARSGDLTFDEADQLGKAFGVDGTRKLLYDLHDRGQFFDAARIVFPFGNAWQEVATTWGRIGITENPLVFRRGQQIVNGMRQANVDGEDEGIFFTDSNGEEAFAIPFSGWINEKLSGVDSRLTGSVQGLNTFASSVIPGLGPVITAPLAKVIPNRPEFENFQELLFPFGEKEYEGGVTGGFLGSLMPTWSQKILKAVKANPETDRVFANNVAYSARYLLSTGRYDLNTAEGKDQLEQDSITAARKLFMLRGLAQIWSPSAPSQEYVTLDREGNGLLQARLVEEYQKLLNDTANGGYKTATERFVEKFGEGAILTVVSRTEGGAPPTEETNTFAKAHPDVVRTYRDVYGFFLERGGEFSYQAYKDQIATGERQTVTPKEAMEIANQRLGQMVYNQHKAMVGERPTREQRAWLGKVRDAIEVEYPGYNPTPASLRDNKLLITRMVEASADPVLAATKAGQGLRQYLVARSQAQAVAESRGLKSFTHAKAATDLRTYLRDVAEEVELQFPAFGELFERTFNREMIVDAA
jgi:hypothetical protein